MKLTHALVALVLAGACCAHAQQPINVNLCSNPGFEETMPVQEGDGMPVGWGTHVGKGKAEFAIVEDEPHSGQSCAYIRAYAPNPSGYWTSPRIPVEGGKKYVFRCWYRSRDVEPSSRGIIFSLNFRSEDNSACGWVSDSAEPFDNPWTLVEITAAAGPDAAYLNLVVGLADSAGELWIDDIYFANTGEIREDMLPTEDIIARPFPQHWMPEDRSIGLIRGEAQPLLFLIQNQTKKQVDNPAIALLLPEGVEVTGGDWRIQPPTEGEPVEHEGARYLRWVCPVEDSRYLRGAFDYYNGSLIYLRTDLEPGARGAYYQFTCDQESQEPQAVTIGVLDPLPEPPKLGRYHIGMLLTDAYRGGEQALEGLADLYAHTGMNACTWSVTPDPTTLGRLLKERGVLRQFLLPGAGVVYNCAFGNKDPSIAITNAAGEPDLSGLCPTYTAERGEHFEQTPLDDPIGKWIRADVMDGFTINWEPPGQYKLEDYCWDDRCLEAFAEYSHIPLGTLKQLGPAGILEQHKLAWARFRAETEGRIAKAYYDKTRELEAEVGRPLMFIPWTGTGRYQVANPTQEQIDELITMGGDVEHPYYYRDWVDAHGPFTYAYYDVISERWRGRHGVTLDRARQVVDFARAQNPEHPKPVWLGIEGIQKGSMQTLCWATTPEQMELEIVGALAEGCEGIYIYTGRGMDGHFYTAAARAVRRAALLEQFTDGPVADGVKLSIRGSSMDPEKVAYVARGWLFSDGKRWLLILAGLDFKRSFPMLVQLPQMPEGRYGAADYVTGEPFGTMRSYGAGQLGEGVEVDLAPGSVHTFLIQPL